MLIAALIVMMIVNRNVKIPATQMFYALIAVILVLSVLDFLNSYLAWELDRKPTFDPVRMRTVVDAVAYILRPLVILIELLMIIPKWWYRLLCVVPAIVNAAVYATAFFGSGFAFYIEENNRWQGGALPWQLVYAVQLLYVVLLLICSIYSFGHRNRKHGVILLMIVLMAVSTTVLEFENVLTEISTTIAAFCVLLYYIYLASIYQQEISEAVEEKGLHIARQELLLLRGQIDPVFISDALGTIRALAKTDKRASAEAIDSFSAYLRAHMNAIRDDLPVSLQSELECVRAYLELLRIGEQKKVELVCELQETDFFLPAMTLESVTEYCIKKRPGEASLIKIQTTGDQENIRICVWAALTEKERTGKREADGDALENARRRLELQCGGTLTTNDSAHGVSAVIIIPRKAEAN